MSVAEMVESAKRGRKAPREPEPEPVGPAEAAAAGPSGESGAQMEDAAGQVREGVQTKIKAELEEEKNRRLGLKQGQQPSGTGEAAPGPEAPQQGKMVPVAALIQERGQFQNRLAMAEAELNAMRQAMTRMGNLQGPQAPAAPEALPDPLLDPDAYAKEIQRRLVADFETKNRPILEQLQHVQAQAQQSALINTITVQQQQFQTEHPDYPKALDHLAKARMGFLTTLAGGDQQRAALLLSQESRQLAEYAMQSGLNVAQVFYEAARSMGWAGGANGNGPGAGVADLDAARKQADQQKRGVDASRSLSAAAGASRPGKLSVEDFVRLTPSQMAKLPYDQRMAILSGGE